MIGIISRNEEWKMGVVAVLRCAGNEFPAGKAKMNFRTPNFEELTK